MIPLNIPDEPQQVVIELSDLSIGDGVIKRKATATDLVVDIKNSGVTLTWWVEHYESINGGYGELLENEAIRSYQKSFITRPDDWVDGLGVSQLQTDEYGNIIRPEGTVSAYRYFNYLAFNVNVKIADVMRANGLKQNALNKF